MTNNHLINQTDAVYECSNELDIEYRNIDYPELYVFSRNLIKFLNGIGDELEDEFWRKRKQKLKRLAFHLSSAPLNKDYLRDMLNSEIESFESDLIYCEFLYPAISVMYKSVIDNLKAILDTQLEKMKIYVDELMAQLEGSIALLVKNTKAIPILEETYKDHDIHVVSTNSLRGNSTYDNIIVIGSTSEKWFPDFVFSSPRAKKYFVIKFQWMKGSWKPKTFFANPITSPKRKTIILGDDKTIEQDENIDANLILPTIDFSAIITETWKQVEEDSEIEYVEAIIGYLENDLIVFLDYGDSSTIRIIDVEDEKTPVKKIRVRDLTPEMFLLLKTSGGGDYIIPVANKILGSKSYELRKTQKDWKDRLRKMNFEKGTDLLIYELISKGCSIANQNNLRNWMSYRSIKTHQYSHFKIILKLIGLGDQTTDIWQKMGLITQAHIKAGRYINDLLLKMAKDADLNQLMRLGIMEFELPDKESGSITAFRIKALSESNKTVLVSPTKINIPLDID